MRLAIITAALALASLPALAKKTQTTVCKERWGKIHCTGPEGKTVVQERWGNTVIDYTPNKAAPATASGIVTMTRADGKTCAWDTRTKPATPLGCH